MTVPLSIVLGTYNRLDQLRNCVESIQAQTSIAHIIYISDAGSTDGTVEYLMSIKSSVVRPVLMGRRTGQARAYNDVFDIVDTPFVCWLSDDNVIVNHGLDLAVSALQKHPRLGMVGLKVKDLQGPFTDAPYGGGISTIGILNVNQGVLPTHVLQALGGFSETFRDYGIDPDLTARVLFSGWDIALTKQIGIHHYRNWSTVKGSPEHKKMKMTQKRAVWMYSAKYGPYYSVGIRHSIKRRLFAAMQRLWPRRLYINTAERFLGMLPRDLFNLFNGRFITLFDPIFTAGLDHHLVQHCPIRLLPPELPPDPPEFMNDQVGASTAKLEQELADVRNKLRLKSARLDEVKARLNRTTEELKFATAFQEGGRA